MVDFIQMLKVFFLGIVEGITEWLPISSTGHLILVDEFLHLSHPNNPAFKDMFIDVIQLGAILAVVLVFFKDLWPFGLSDSKKPMLKKNTFSMWLKIIVACIPGAVAAFAFNDFIEANLSSPYIIAAALIVYGIAFILIENHNKKRTSVVDSIDDISFGQALLIGLFQVLSIIPGTSRSGAVDNSRHLPLGLDDNRRADPWHFKKSGSAVHLLPCRSRHVRSFGTQAFEIHS